MNVLLRRALEKGEYPLLTSSQLGFFDEVDFSVKSQLYLSKSTDNWHFPDKDDPGFQVTLQIYSLPKKLGLIIENLNGVRLEEESFTEGYWEWKERRDACIVQLTELASSLRSNRFNCNVSRLAGYSTSLIGGGVSLASAILIPFSFGLTTPLAIAGGVITAAGASTAVGTSITEVALLKSKVDQAKILIEEDMKYFEQMSPFLNHASALQEAISSVLTCDIMKDMSEKIKEFVGKAVTISSDSKRKKFIETTLKAVITFFIPKFAEMAIPVVAIATVISVLVAVFLLMLNTENRLAFDCASLAIKSIVGVASLVENSMGAIHLSSLVGGNTAVAKHVARGISRGSVAAICIVLDVVGIVYTSVDIHKGSVSPEAEKITQAVRKLSEEAVVLQTIHASCDRQLHECDVTYVETACEL